MSQPKYQIPLTFDNLMVFLDENYTVSVTAHKMGHTQKEIASVLWDYIKILRAKKPTPQTP